MRRLISSHSLTHSIFSSMTYVFLMARYLKIVIFKSIKVLTTHAEIDTKRQSTHVPPGTRSGARAYPSLHLSNSSAAISASRGFKAQLYRKHPSLLDFLYSDFTRFNSNKNISESVIVLLPDLLRPIVYKTVDHIFICNVNSECETID